MNNKQILAKILQNNGYESGAEVGVAGGHMSEIILENNPQVTKYFAIDPWETYEENKRGGKQEQHDDNLKLTHEKLDKYPSVTYIRAYSTDAMCEFEKESLDFIFIDGNHDFDYVLEDVIGWTRKVRKGGIVAGHDFYHFNNSGVIEAITAYCNFHKIGFNIIGENKKGKTDHHHPIWWFYKK